MFGDDNDVTHEDVDTTTEDEAQESPQGEGSSEGDDSDGDTVTLTTAELEAKLKEARKDQDKRWKQRLKVGGEGDGDDQEEAGTTAQDSDDRYDRLELKTEGVTVKAEQDLVIDYARHKKISVTEALQRPGVKAELKELRDKASTPPPSRRTGGGETGTLEYYVDQYKKGGKSAPTVEMRRKVRQALKNRA